MTEKSHATRLDASLKWQLGGAIIYQKVGPDRELNPGPPRYSPGKRAIKARTRNHATRPSGLYFETAP